MGFSHKRILVTGGAGFLGSHLCERLLDEGNGVICVDNFVTGKRENIAHLINRAHFSVIYHDISFPFFLEADEIYNLASLALPLQYILNPLKAPKTALNGALNMLAIAKRTSAKILHASTNTVYGDFKSHPQSENEYALPSSREIPLHSMHSYDESKRCAETLFFDYHEQYGVEIKIARVFNTIGPRMNLSDGRQISHFISSALAHTPIKILGSPDEMQSFCFISDMIDGLLSLMQSAPSITGPVNLGSPEAYPLLEIAQKICALTDSDSPITHAPHEQRLLTARRPDIRRARELLGWTPYIPFEAGLEETLNWFMNAPSKLASQPL